MTAALCLAGYDGQLYRLALAPADLGPQAHGVRLDTPPRRQRLGYPVLAWLLSGGRPALVAWALPVLAFVAWQVTVAAASGSAPLLDDTSNLSLPFAALVPAAGEWLTDGPGPAVGSGSPSWPW